MQTPIAATFVDGVLKPDVTLSLPVGARVYVTIEPIADVNSPAAAWRELKERIQQRPIHSGGVHFTRDELHERS